MDDPRWLRLVVVGLVLAALVVVYFLFSGAFVKGKTTTKTTQTTQTQVQQTISSPNPNALPSVVNESSSSAYESLVDKSQGNVTTLPKTGLPLVLVVIASISAIVSGLSLRKFPD